MLLDEINLASAETLQCLSGLLEGGSGSLERGDATPTPCHPDFRLLAAMNPATDVGKKELPPGIRNRQVNTLLVQCFHVIQVRYSDLRPGGGEPIPFINELMSLGIVLDRTLTWKPHIILTTRKVKGALFGYRFIQRSVLLILMYANLSLLCLTVNNLFTIY